MEDSKKYLRPILSGVVFYIALKYTPVFGVISTLIYNIGLRGVFHHALTEAAAAFLLYLPLPFIAGNKKHGLIAAIIVVVLIHLNSLIGSYFSLISLSLMAASIAGVYAAHIFIHEIFGGESDTKIQGAIKKDGSPIYKVNCDVISFETRDESSTSVTSHVEDELISVGSSTARVPRTVYNFTHNKKIVQDIWVKNEEGKEKKVRLINSNIDVKENQNIDLIYTLNGNLEYIDNHSTGNTTKLYNYIFDYRKVNNGVDIWSSFFVMLMLCLPFIGTMMAILSITTGYSYINKPFKRSYLGKSLLVSSIFTAVVSSLFSLVVWNQFATPGFSFEVIIRFYILAVIITLLARVFAQFLMVRKAKKMEKLFLSYI